MKTLCLLSLLVVTTAAHAGRRAEITISRTSSGPAGYSQVHEEHVGRRHRITCTGAGSETGDVMRPPKVNGSTADFAAIDREVKARVEKEAPGARGYFEWPGAVLVRYTVLRTGYTYTIEDR